MTRRLPTHGRSPHHNQENMKPEKLYDLIYSLAPYMNWNEEELNSLLGAADSLSDIGMSDLQDLVYKLAEQGLIDGDALNTYLNNLDNMNKN